MKGKAVPKGWPEQVPYISKPIYSKAIPKDTLARLHAKPSGVDAITRTDGPVTNVIIRSIRSPNHPANGQHGLFAAKDLAPGTLILCYTGFVHGEKDTDPNSDYDLSLDRELGISVDAAKTGNEARFINDYRNISTTGPNAEFKEAWIATDGAGLERRMTVFVLPAGKRGTRSGGIKRGEEILLSYGRGFWKQRQAPNDGDLS